MKKHIDAKMCIRNFSHTELPSFSWCHFMHSVLSYCSFKIAISIEATADINLGPGAIYVNCAVRGRHFLFNRGVQCMEAKVFATRLHRPYEGRPTLVEMRSLNPFSTFTEFSLGAPAPLHGCQAFFRKTECNDK